MRRMLLIFFAELAANVCRGQVNSISMIEIESTVSQQVIRNHTPSIRYILFSKDNIIIDYSFGRADIKSNKLIDKKTTYNAFSVTKTFTALAILKLAERKQLNIDESIKKYLPEFPYDSSITIRQLLTHSAGIPNPNPLDWIHLPNEHNSFKRNEFFLKIFNKNKNSKFKPNERYSYSNLGYVVLGQLIEKLGGVSYEKFITDNIFKVLALNENDLDFQIKDINAHAKGYQKRFSLLNMVLGFFIDKSRYMDMPEGKWKPFKSFYVNGAPYGGLIGTAESFVKYIQELLKSNTLLIGAHYKQMLFEENRLNNEKETGVCLSWFKGYLDGQEYFAHAGGGGGYYCEIRMYPELGIGSVVFFNRSGMKDERFLNKVDEIYIRELFKTKFTKVK